jgi:IclR family KDG regulon transcriptional repressor
MGKSVKVIEKAFHILEQISNQNNLSLKEISERTELPKPTASRILDTMQTLGYVEQDSNTQRFQLGSNFLSFVKKSNSTTDVTVISEPFMKRLLVQFGETVNLARLRDTQIVYVRILESRNAFRISDNIGDRASIHSTAIGKSIGAFLPKDNLNEFIKNCSFQRFTRKTIIDEPSLRRHLLTVRQNGYALDNEEGHDGVICVGAPIFNKDNLPFAAISISMPKVRAKKVVLQNVVRELHKVSIQISLELGVTDIRKCLEQS